MMLQVTVWLISLLTFLTLTEAKPHNTSDDDGLIVQLARPASKIRGHILQSSLGFDFYAFQDIPYAQTPIGKYRFQPPTDIDPWDGVLDTTSNKRICPQGANPFERYSKTKNKIEESEDCLLINVYTPYKPASNASLPVFFWIHGGAWLGGSGSIAEYDPKYLIDYNVIIVTFNYRMGAFGFLTTNDDVIPGNLGYKDQHFALKWTYDNIHLFGGDPDKITLGGESAGSMAAGVQLLSPLNNGLFRQVIQQSGSAISSFSYQDNYREWAFKFGRAVDKSFNSTSSKDLLEVIQQATYEEIFKAQTDLQAKVDDFGGFIISLVWTPIIEDSSVKGAIVTEQMLQNFIDGNFNLVPLFIGFNSEEALLYYNSGDTGTFLKASKLYDDDSRLLVSEKLNIAEENREIVGNNLKQLYTSTSFLEDKAAFVRYTSDRVFIRSILRQADEASKHVPVYLYELSWEANQGEIPGVEHGNDLVYLWLDEDNSEYPYDENLRRPLLKLWTNFIKLQDPTPKDDPEIQNIRWPTVDPDGSLRFLNINKTFEILENPRQYSKIRQILDPYVQPPYNVY